MIRPCGTCLRAEFADEDEDELADRYFVQPGSSTGHVQRPRGSEGKGSPMAQAIRAGRGRQTYCGIQMHDGWVAEDR